MLKVPKECCTEMKFFECCAKDIGLAKRLSELSETCAAKGVK